MQEEEFDFEWFGKKGASTPTSRPRVGIQKKGTYSINAAAARVLEFPSHVKLGFDKARRVIGIKAADPNEPGAYPVRKQPNSTNFLFSGIAFSNRNGIPIGESRRYWAEDRGGTLVVDLNQEPDSSSWPLGDRGEAGRATRAKTGEAAAE